MTIKKRQGWRGLLSAAAALLLMQSILPVTALAAEPADAMINISVYKQVVGDMPKIDETCSFNLNAVDGAPMPDGSANGAKTVQITGEGNISFGQISYTELGEYHYTISEAAGSNPRYSYDQTVYSANVQVAWKDKVGGEMTATLYLAKEDGICKQEKALFTNQYTMPVPVSIDPPVQKVVNGSSAVAEIFIFRFAADSTAAPMPNGSTGGVKDFSRVGPGQAEAGIVTFTEPGTYRYTISEVNGGLAHCTYDKTVYTMMVNVIEENGRLQQSTQYFKADGTAVPVMNFTNTFEGYLISPWTGDTANPIFWSGLLAVMSMAAIAIAIWKKKDKAN